MWPYDAGPRPAAARHQVGTEQGPPRSDSLIHRYDATLRRPLSTRRASRLLLLVTSFVTTLAVAACGGSTATPVASPSVAAPPSVPGGYGTSPAPTTGTTKTYESELGASITLPTDWIAITPKDVTNPNVLVPLRSKAGPEAVNALVSAIGEHPEYWLAAIRPSDQSVLTAQIREASDFEAWSKQQEDALEASYPDVQRTEVTAPVPGVRFSFTSGDYASRVYGFERPGGVALFTFAGSASAADTWDDALLEYSE